MSEDLSNDTLVALYKLVSEQWETISKLEELLSESKGEGADATEQKDMAAEEATDLQEEVDELKSDKEVLENDVTRLEGEVDELEQEVANLSV